MCIHVHKYEHMCIRVHTSANMCTHVHACAYVCIHVHTCAYMSIHLDIDTYITFTLRYITLHCITIHDIALHYIHTYITYMHIYIHTYKCHNMLSQVGGLYSRSVWSSCPHRTWCPVQCVIKIQDWNPSNKLQVKHSRRTFKAIFTPSRLSSQTHSESNSETETGLQAHLFHKTSGRVAHEYEQQLCWHMLIKISIESRRRSGKEETNRRKFRN